MTVFINGEKTDDFDLRQTEGVRLVCFADAAEEERLAGLPWAGALRWLQQTTATRFESRDGFDYISIEVPDVADPKAEPRQLQAVFTGGSLVVIHRQVHAAECALEDIRDHGGETTPERALYLLFAHLTASDSARLDDIEEEIAGLEDEMVRGTPEDGTGRISALRRRLLALKRYYEALFDLLEDLEENVNGFIGKEQLRSFRIQTNRADRLNRQVLNLRDYVTQVREAYQNQLDISLNETMKLFTVITTVFLPLTLLAGWYGMNLKMPEYNSPWAYPVIIIVSLVVVVGCLLYFKRKKWF